MLARFSNCESDAGEHLYQDCGWNMAAWSSPRS